VPKWVLDLETFSFREINDAAFEYYGYNREEFRKLTLPDIMTSGEFSMFEQWIRESRSSGKKIEGTLMARHQKKNGEIVAVEVHHGEIVYAEGKALLAVILDRSLAHTGRGIT
jgi:PAS domain S-box-containing protein